MWEYGTFEKTRIVGDDKKRFWSKVKKTDGCWLWAGNTNGAGYGRFALKGKKVYPHRYSYELSKGSIPENFVIDHLCRTPLCVNPEHLEAVTNRDNGVRGLRVTAKKSGLPLGVSRKRDKFRATIMINGKSKILGSTFTTPEEAHNIYMGARSCL